MKRILGLAAVLAVAASLVQGGDQPKRSVNYASDWQAAVSEARMLNVPIVVHSHGFY